MNVKMDCLNRDAMTQYFDLLIEDLLKEVLTENNQMNSPGRIYNVDVIGDHGSIDQTSVMDSTSNRTSSMDSSSDHVSVTSSSSDQMSLMDSSSDHTSLMDTVLSDVSIATSVAVVSGLNDASSVVEHHSEALAALQQRESTSNVKGGEGNASTAHVSKVSKPNAVENGELRYISKYLVQFVADTKSQIKEEVVRAPVLTSDKYAAILKEHEKEEK